MKTYNVITSLLISLLFVSCSSPINLDTLEETSNLVSFKKKGINIQYRAVKKLNFYEFNNHSMTFIIYQLNDINNFNLLMKEPKEREKLMSGRKFDNTVISFEQFFIIPNKKGVITIDRVKGAKWVVLLAGYYNFNTKEDVYIAFQSLIKEKHWYDFDTENIEYKALDIKVLFNQNKLQAEVVE